MQGKDSSRGEGGEEPDICDPGSELRLGGRKEKKGEGNKCDVIKGIIMTEHHSENLRPISSSTIKRQNPRLTISPLIPKTAPTSSR